jgi:RNA polymerase sigma factor (TIGR02999 family)
MSVSIDGNNVAMHTWNLVQTEHKSCSRHTLRRFDQRHRMSTIAANKPQNRSVTELIAAAESKVPDAINSLFNLLYKDLYRVANARLHEHGRPHDMSATALVHETYERLVQLKELRVSDRNQFFTYASAVMRSVIVDLARARYTERRGGGVSDIPLNTFLEASIASPLDESVLEISEALDQLALVEPRLAQIVEMRYFGGLSVLEIAEIMQVTERTVARDWVKARSLLAAMLTL